MRTNAAATSRRRQTTTETTPVDRAERETLIREAQKRAADRDANLSAEERAALEAKRAQWRAAAKASRDRKRAAKGGPAVTPEREAEIATHEAAEEAQAATAVTVVPEPDQAPAVAAEDERQVGPLELSKRELAAIVKLWPGDRSGIVVTRKSEREFDLSVKGPGFSAWLVLAVLRELPWTSPEIAEMTAYPAMAANGDWSAVRDTPTEQLWLIFNGHVTRFLLSGPRYDGGRKGKPAAEKAPKVAKAKVAKATKLHPQLARHIGAGPAKAEPAAKAPKARGSVLGTSLIMGHDPADVGVWLGANGATPVQAVAAYKALGVDCHRLAERKIKWLAYRGANATTLGVTVPTFTEEEQAELLVHAAR